MEFHEVKNSMTTKSSNPIILHHLPLPEKPPCLAMMNHHFLPQDRVIPQSIPKLNPDFHKLFFNAPTYDPLSPNTSSLITHSIPTNFDNPKEHHSDATNERKLKRMISNRESARRSRIRKRKQVEELQIQVDQLRAVNNQLSEKLITLLDGNNQILQENAQLKEKVNSLQVIVMELLTPFRGLDEFGFANHQLKS